VGLAALTRTWRQAVQIVMLSVGAWLVITNRASMSWRVTRSFTTASASIDTAAASAVMPR
jgi:ABC-type protease/lipase transport system fused ATPase/permease subunit